MKLPKMITTENIKDVPALMDELWEKHELISDDVYDHTIINGIVHITLKQKFNHNVNLGTADMVFQ